MGPTGKVGSNLTRRYAQNPTRGVEMPFRNMNKRLLLGLTAGLLLCTTLWGQTSESSSWWWRSDSLHYHAAERMNLPSLLSHTPPGRLTAVGIGVHGASITPVRLASIPHRQQDYTLFARGYKTIGRFALSGTASFGRKREVDLSHNLTANDHLFYPFVVADTVSKKLRTEAYHMSFAAGYRMMPHLDVGLSAGYTGEMRYGRKDPRVQNISSDVQAAASASWDLHSWGQVSAGYSTRHYIQQLGFSVLTPSATEPIYIMRPMGEYNFRYSGLEDQGAYRHRYAESTTTAVWLLPALNARLVCEYARSNARLETREAGVYLNELRGWELRPNLQSDVLTIGAHTWAIRLGYSHEEKGGEERIYKFEKIDDHTSLTNAVLLATENSYAETSHTTEGGVEWRRRDTHSRWVMGLDYERKAFDGRHRTDTLRSHFSQNALRLSLGLKWQRKRTECRTDIVGRFLITDTRLQKLNREQLTHIIEQDRLVYLGGPRLRLHAVHEYRYRLHAGKPHMLSLTLAGEAGFWQQARRTYGGSATIAYLF